MCQYAKEYRLQLLIARKLTVMKSLEWAIVNNDRGMADVCERELKILLKNINKVKKELENRGGKSKWRSVSTSQQ